MDFARFVQIYLVQGGFALFFLYMAYIVLKRGKKHLHLYLSSFYLTTAIGGIINIIYANIFDATIVYIQSLIKHGDPIPLGVSMQTFKDIPQITRSRANRHTQEVKVACAI